MIAVGDEQVACVVAHRRTSSDDGEVRPEIGRGPAITFVDHRLEPAVRGWQASDNAGPTHAAIETAESEIRHRSDREDQNYTCSETNPECFHFPKTVRGRLTNRAYAAARRFHVHKRMASTEERRRQLQARVRRRVIDVAHG